MKAPKIPSFFKVPISKSFSFRPRYYDERKERHAKTKKNINISLNRNQTTKVEKGRNARIILLIIILSLLAYKFIIN
tara:strand:+ start:354 stop:584 length:231 start_codon:yes stop_codon:yes gene_type:complete